MFAEILLGLAVALGAAEPAEDDKRPRKSKVHEAVSVTADLDWLATAPVASGTSSVDPGEAIVPPASLTDVLESVPGVSENGQGGLFQVVSLRGVSGQRVTSLISGMRISSERRAGVSSSFVDPQLMDRVEVLRGPATSLYGSGALGGATQIFPKQFDGWSFSTGWDSDADKTFQSVGTGGDGWSWGAAHRQSQRGEAADGTRLNSAFDQYSTAGTKTWSRGESDFALLGIVSYGRDIEKTNTDFPDTRTTNYPIERHQLAKFSVDSPSLGSLLVYVHAQDLETDVLSADSRNRVFNKSVDFGARWTRAYDLGGSAQLRYGLEDFSRRNVDAEEINEDLSGGLVESLDSTLDNASLDELGGFGVLRWEWKKATWEVGGRLSWIDADDGGSLERTDSALNGFVGVSRPVGHGIQIGARLDSGVRFANLGELFFSGTTGRGEVTGNPDLDSERALSGEVELRWVGRRALWSIATFRNDVDDYIERIDITPVGSTPDEFTFVNLVSGTITGYEMQGLYRPADGWNLFVTAHGLRGRDDAGGRLADVPVDEIEAGGEWTGKSLGVAARIARRAEKSDPGDGEKSIPSATLLSASLDYRLSPRVRLGLAASNLLDEEHFRSADKKAPSAPGRSIALTLSWVDR